MAETGELRFEEGFAWLASQVLDDPIYNSKDILMKQKQQHQRQLRHIKMSAEPFFQFQHSRPHHRPKSPTWAPGGSGMQAIFLESGQKSCGTGVFIPRSKKPACSPVLLPARVVQALNLNVHALGLQISPNEDIKNDVKRRLVEDVRIENADKEVSVHCCVISQNSTSAADFFLPKEWTY